MSAFAVEPQAVSAEVQPAAEAQPNEDNRSAYLIKLLEGSSQFRVRALAASALGQLEPSEAVRRALTQALRDEFPAVRAAAATSLGRIGDANQVTALHELARDPEEPVRNAAQASIGKLETAIEEFPVVFHTASNRGW